MRSLRYYAGAMDAWTPALDNLEDTDADNVNEEVPI